MKINEEIKPQTIKEAVDFLIDSMSKEDLKFIRNNEEINCHHTIGRYIRNTWNLWDKNSPIKKDAIKTYKIAHGDDLSGLIFEWTFKRIRNENFYPFELCQAYERYWRTTYNMSALEAGGIKGD